MSCNWTEDRAANTTMALIPHNISMHTQPNLSYHQTSCLSPVYLATSADGHGGTDGYNRTGIDVFAVSAKRDGSSSAKKAKRSCHISRP